MITSSSSDSRQFIVRFWGVRGSIPTPDPDMLRYGGNTSCVEVQVAGKRLIFDGGTGLRGLGKQMMTELPVQAHLFFTHTHWDRIQGFPFFMPAFVVGNQFQIYGATGQNGASIKQRLSDQMLRPHFPVPLQRMQADLQFRNITPGSEICLDDVVIQTMLLHRASNALGYRITWNGYSVVYATETEYLPNRPNQTLLYLAQQADLLIYDAAHTEHAYTDHTQYRHLDDYQAVPMQRPPTWYTGIEAATEAQVKQMILSHHDPTYEDAFLDQIEAEVQATFPSGRLAREGMVISVVPHQSPVR
jgi:phosphoribosyl 1,2-cyclic phosphodiesterase